MDIKELRETDDFSQLFHLSKLFFKEYSNTHEFFFQIDVLHEEQVINYFRNFIDQQNKKVFIANEGNKIVGYIAVYFKEQADFWKIKTVGDISGLMVNPEFRRKGIAKLLLEEAKRFLRENNVKYCTLFTSTNNYGALKFYEKCGFSPLHLNLLTKT